MDNCCKAHWSEKPSRDFAGLRPHLSSQNQIRERKSRPGPPYASAPCQPEKKRNSARPRFSRQKGVQLGPAIPPAQQKTRAFRSARSVPKKNTNKKNTKKAGWPNSETFGMSGFRMKAGRAGTSAQGNRAWLLLTPFKAGPRIKHLVERPGILQRRG